MATSEADPMERMGAVFLFFHKKSIPGVHALMTCALLEINATKRACSGKWLVGLDQ